MSDIPIPTVSEAFALAGYPVSDDSEIYARGDSTRFNGTWWDVFGHWRDDGRPYWFLEDPRWGWHRNKWVTPTGPNVADDPVHLWMHLMPPPILRILNGDEHPDLVELRVLVANIPHYALVGAPNTEVQVSKAEVDMIRLARGYGRDLSYMGSERRVQLAQAFRAEFVGQLDDIIIEMFERGFERG